MSARSNIRLVIGLAAAAVVSSNATAQSLSGPNTLALPDAALERVEDLDSAAAGRATMWRLIAEGPTEQTTSRSAHDAIGTRVGRELGLDTEVDRMSELANSFRMPTLPGGLSASFSVTNCLKSFSQRKALDQVMPGLSEAARTYRVKLGVSF